MNTIEDVQKIFVEYYLNPGAQMQLVEDNEAGVIEGAKQAEIQFVEGLVQLERLKLSPADRRHFKLLRGAFYDIITAMREIRKGNKFKAVKFSKQSVEKAARYAQARGLKL